MTTLADGYTQLAKDLSIPTCLEEVGIKEKDLQLLAREASKIERLLQNNMRKVEEKDAFDLYSQALKS